MVNSTVIEFRRLKKKDFMYVSGKKYDGMMGRCYRETDRSYKSYGGKGIRVSAEWILNIENFRIWLRNHLKEYNISEEDFVNNPKQYQLDRIDPLGHYTAKNCRISSPQENTRNRVLNKGKKVMSAEGIELIFGE